jgi:DNA-binding MarR family transcriptional regulator
MWVMGHVPILCFTPMREADRADRAPELVDLLFATMSRLKGHFQRRTSEFGLTMAQAQTLLMISPDEAEPMRDLAGRLGVDPSNLTGLVDRLEDRGLVERRPAAHDRRVKTLALTDAGVDLRGELFARALDGAPPASGLSLDEQRTLEALLGKVVAASPPGDGPVWSHDEIAA